MNSTNAGTTEPAVPMRMDTEYYARLPIFYGFDSVMDPARYQPLWREQIRAFEFADDATESVSAADLESAIFEAVARETLAHCFQHIFAQERLRPGD